jgi:serine/threonine protein kinase
MKGHGFAVDWWTLGILVYEMATGRPPFMHKSHHKLGVLIRTQKIVWPDPVRHKIHMSAELKDFIAKLLDRNPKTRLGSGPDDANELVCHPFFEGFDWDALIKKEIKAEYTPEIDPEHLQFYAEMQNQEQ